MNKKNIIVSSLIAFTCSAIIISCAKDKGRQPVAPPAPSVNACDTITYDKHIKKLMVGDCESCHNPSLPSGGVDLTTYELVKAKAVDGRIKARVIDGENGYMPQDKGKLPQAKLDLINCWLQNGQKK